MSRQRGPVSLPADTHQPAAGSAPTAHRSPDTNVNNRMSIVSGPRLRHYESIVWSDEDDTSSRASSVSDLSFRVKEAVRVRVGGQKEKAVAVPSSWKGHKSVASPTASVSTFASSKDFSSSTSGTSLSLSTSTGSSVSQVQTPNGDQADDSLKSFDLAQRFRDASIKLLEPFDETQKTPVAPLASRAPRTYGPPTKAAMNSTSAFLRHQTTPVTDGFPPSTTSGVKLISLCEAQERERRRRNRTAPPDASVAGQTSLADPGSFPIPQLPSTPSSRTPGSQHVKGKKSGFMKMLNRTPRSARPTITVSSPIQLLETPKVEPLSSSVKLKHAMESGSPPRPVHTPRVEMESRSLMPQLELRPVSMNFASGLPFQYLSLDHDSAHADPPPLPPKPERIPNESRNDAVTVVRSAALEKEAPSIKQLENQVRSLKSQLRAANARLGELHANDGACPQCGNVQAPLPITSIMDRGRVKAGTRTIFGASDIHERG